MGEACFLCGEPNCESENNELLVISTEYGDVINLIHKECYEYDYRPLLDRKKILNLKVRNDEKII